MGDVQKGRYADASQRRLYPIATFNSWTARPLSAVLTALRFTPNMVSLLSLLISIAAMALIAQGVWDSMVAGAALLHLGLVLDHADGQVARRRGMGSTWGMYLDMVIDRIVEVGAIVAVAAAIHNGTSGAPAGWTAWAPFSAGTAMVLAVATIGIMMTWRFLTAYNDVLYLRSHLLATGKVPEAGERPRSLGKRPLMPLVFNRDWILLFMVVGIIANQLQGLLLLLFVTHCLVTLEKIIVFKVRHGEPAGDVNRILGRDYH